MVLDTAHGHQRRMLEALRTFPHAASVYPFGDVLHYGDSRADLAAGAIATELRGYLASQGVRDATIDAIRPGVEDTFMALMKTPDPVP